MNINVGGEKGWKNIDPKVRANWLILDTGRGTDVQYDINSKEPIPLEDNSVDNYYTSHTLEHVETFTVPFVMSELYRTLKPNGMIRIVVPDIKYGIYLYHENSDELHNKTYCTKDKSLPDTPLGHLACWWYSQDRGKDGRYSGHKTAYDYETLRWYLLQAMFMDIYRWEFNSGSKLFLGLDISRYAGWSLFVEARKSCSSL